MSVTWTTPCCSPEDTRASATKTSNRQHCPELWSNQKGRLCCPSPRSSTATAPAPPTPWFQSPKGSTRVHTSDSISLATLHMAMLQTRAPWLLYRHPCGGHWGHHCWGIPSFSDPRASGTPEVPTYQTPMPPALQEPSQLYPMPRWIPSTIIPCTAGKRTRKSPEFSVQQFICLPFL